MWWTIPVVVSFVWVGLSIKIVGPAEMAVKIIFGKPVDVCDSGWVVDLRLPFGRRFKCFLQRYPKKMYNFDYRAREVITQAGEYKETYYGSQTLKVNSVAYLNFPRQKRSKKTEEDELRDIETDINGIEKTHPLIKILRAQVPVEDGKLKDWTEEAVLGALRVAFGEMTWMEAVENIKKITEKAEIVFKAADGALIRAGFSKKGIQLVIAEITLPSALQRAMPGVDRQRLQAEASKFEAEQRAEETTGFVVQAFCRLTGMEQEEVQKRLKEDSAKFVADRKEMWEKAWDTVYREMALKRGARVDIGVEGAGGFEKLILNALAAWQRMPSGKDSERGHEEKEGRKTLVEEFLEGKK